MAVSGAILAKSQSCLDSLPAFLARRSSLSLTLYDRTWWYRAFGLSGQNSASRVVATELLLRTDAGGVCWPSRNRLELETGICKRHLRRIVSKMVSEGWIEYLTWDQRSDHCVKRGLPLRAKDDKNSIMYRLSYPSAVAFDSARALMAKDSEAEV